MRNIINLDHDGVTYAGMTVSQLLDAGVPRAAVDAEIERLGQVEGRERVRSAIARDVGDTASRLGTVSDATGLLIAIALAEVVALSSNTGFADYRRAKLATLGLLAGDEDIAAVAGAALTKIKDGDAVLTAGLKGLDNVIAEILAGSTAVAAILSRAAGASDA